MALLIDIDEKQPGAAPTEQAPIFFKPQEPPPPEVVEAAMRAGTPKNISLYQQATADPAQKFVGYGGKLEQLQRRQFAISPDDPTASALARLSPDERSGLFQRYNLNVPGLEQELTGTFRAQQERELYRFAMGREPPGLGETALRTAKELGGGAVGGALAGLNLPFNLPTRETGIQASLEMAVGMLAETLHGRPTLDEEKAKAAFAELSPFTQLVTTGALLMPEAAASIPGGVASIGARTVRAFDPAAIAARSMSSAPLTLRYPAFSVSGGGVRFVAEAPRLMDLEPNVVSSGNKFRQLLWGRTGINPAIWRNSPVGRIVTAREALNVPIDELTKTALSAAFDVHATRGLGTFKKVLPLDEAGIWKGSGRHWLDVFDSPGAVKLTAEQSALRDDFMQVIEEMNALRVKNGMRNLQIRGPDGLLSVPRQVESVLAKAKTLTGAEKEEWLKLTRYSNPELQRVYEEATDAVLKEGVRYRDPRSTLEIFVRSTYRRIADKQLNDALIPYGAKGSELIDPVLRTRFVEMAKKVANAKAVAERLTVPRYAGRGIAHGPGALGRELFAVQDDLSGLFQQAALKQELPERLLRIGRKVFGPSQKTFRPDLSTRQVVNIRRMINREALFVGTEKEALAEAKSFYPNAVFLRGRVLRSLTFRDNPLADVVSKLSPKYVGAAGVSQFLRDVETAVASPTVTVRGKSAVQQIQERIAGLKRLDIASPEAERTLRKALTFARKEAGEQLLEAKKLFAPVNHEYLRALQRVKASSMEIASGAAFHKSADRIQVGRWRNRFYPLEDMKTLRDGLGTFGKGPKDELLFRGMMKVANATRFLQSTMDFATSFIQGLPVLWENPEAWAKATANQYMAWFDPTIQARFLRDHLGTFQEMAQHGVAIGDPEFFAALERGGGVSLEKLSRLIPGGERVRMAGAAVGHQTFGRFQASYNVFLGQSRALLWEASKEGWKGSIDDMAAWVRNMTGALDSRALGVRPRQRAVEGMWLAYSPRLLRSTMALIGDAVAHPRSVRGQRSLAALGKLMAGAGGLYIASGLAMGMSWKEIEKGLNPLSGKRFMAFKINGDWIGIGGQVRAAVAGTTQIISTLAPGGEPAGDILALDRLKNPIFAYLGGRAAVGLNIAGTFAEGLTGGRVNGLPFERIDNLPDIARHIGTGMLPFAVAGHLEGEQWGTTLASMIGARTQAETFAEAKDRNARDLQARLTPDTPAIEGYKNASPEVKRLVQDLPELKDAFRHGQNAVDQDRINQEAKLSAQVTDKTLSIADAVKAYRNIGAAYAIRRGEVEPGKPGNDNEKALGQYYDAVKTATDVFGSLNSDRLDQLLDGLASGWTAEQRQHVANNIGASQYHVEGFPREYAAFLQRRMASGWFQAWRNNDLWAGMSEADRAIVRSWKDWLAQGHEADTSAWMSATGQTDRTRIVRGLGQLDQATERARRKIRYENPELDYGYALYNSRAPLRFTTKARLIRELYQDRPLVVLHHANAGSTQISGLHFEALWEAGVRTLEQMAQMTPEGIETILGRLGRGSPKAETIAKWRWPEQAKGVLELMHGSR